MPKSRRRAGQNIRQLAWSRRSKALLSFSTAGFLFILPFLVNKSIDLLLGELFSNQSAQGVETPNFPILLQILFIITALLCVANGMYWWRRANHADQGAQGEEQMAREMRPLEKIGWRVTYGMKLGRRLGDADIVCISPSGKAYVIDVKSHRGEVIARGKILAKTMGTKTYSFEKDFLKQVKKQAVQVKLQRKLGFVTPIIAFSNATVSLNSNSIQNVYVVDKANLTTLLKSLG